MCLMENAIGCEGTPSVHTHTHTHTHTHRLSQVMVGTGVDNKVIYTEKSFTLGGRQGR